MGDKVQEQNERLRAELAARKEQMRWRSCKDEPPEADCVVLARRAFSSNGEIRYGFKCAYWSSSTGWFWDGAMADEWRPI